MEEKGKKLTMVDIVSLGVGGAIGSGIFVMMGYGIAYTGRSIVFAVSLGCIYMLLAYLFHPIMSSMFVLPGGDYDMKAMLLSPVMTGFSALYSVLSGFGMASYGVAFASYFCSVFTSLQPYENLIAALVLIIFFALSVKGTKALATITTVITVTLLISLGIYIVVGLPQVGAGYFSSTAEDPFFLNGFTGFIGAISMMSFACQGTTMAPVSVMLTTDNPRKKIPTAIMIITVIVGLFYALMSIVSAGVLPVSEVAGQPISVTAQAVFSYPIFVIFILGGACCAIMSSLSSGMTMFRYPLLAVVEDGWLPKGLGKTTADGYPYVLMGLFLAASIIPIFTPLTVDAMISLLMIPSMVLNAYMNIKLISLVKKYPEQWKGSMFHMPTAVFNCLCVLGSVCALAVAYYLFKDLTVGSMILCAVLLAIMICIPYIQLKRGKVKAEDLYAKRDRIAKAALEATAKDNG